MDTFLIVTLVYLTIASACRFWFSDEYSDSKEEQQELLLSALFWPLFILAMMCGYLLGSWSVYTGNRKTKK
jgi:hypothetical protein